MQISGQIQSSHVPAANPMSPSPSPCPCCQPCVPTASPIPLLAPCFWGAAGAAGLQTKRGWDLGIAHQNKGPGGPGFAEWRKTRRFGSHQAGPHGKWCFGAPSPQGSSAPSPDPTVGPCLHGKCLLPLSPCSPKCSTPVWGLSGCPHCVPKARGFGSSQRPPGSGTALQAKEGPHPSYRPELWAGGAS